ncbi:DMT family transporter [Pseudomonas sp. NPDC089401]|uniref:DMT family transporter n=1 Tax=Pseudomonas sp. NPDC089401 TaxID=3364462 RepID=UPI003811792A
MTYIILGLLIAAGAALVAQNLLMVQIMGGVSTALIALLINSAVGFMLLLLLLVGRSGLSGISEALNGLRYWHLLPGVLGSFCVFASLLGYQRLGPATTASVLIASQVLVALLVDAFGAGRIATQDLLMPLIGIAFLIAGVLLIANRGF